MTSASVRLAVVILLVTPVARATAGGLPSPEALRASDLLDDGDVAAARSLAERLATGDSPEPLALQVLGRIARREGRTDDAIRILEAAVARDPASSDAHVHLGGAHVDKLRSVGALLKIGWARKLREVVQRAVELDPESCEARRALAEFYLEAPKIVGGSPERARLEATRFRDRCLAHGHLAFALAAQTGGDLPGARAACVAAIVADPTCAEGFALLGWIERLQGVAPAAPPAADTRDLLDLAPAWHRALHDAGRSGALPGPNIEKAEGGLRAALRREKTAPGKARHRWALGLAHQIRGDRDAAWREYTAALQLAPGTELAERGLNSLRPLPRALAPASGEPPPVGAAPATPVRPETATLEPPTTAAAAVTLLERRVVAIPERLLAPTLVARSNAPPVVVGFERSQASDPSGATDLVALELRADRLVEVQRVPGLVRGGGPPPEVRPPTVGGRSSLLPVLPATDDVVVLVPLSGDALARLPLAIASPVAVEVDGRPLVVGIVEGEWDADRPEGGRTDAPAAEPAESRYQTWILDAATVAPGEPVVLASIAHGGDEAPDALDGVVASDGVLHLAGLRVVDGGGGSTHVEHFSFDLRQSRWLHHEVLASSGSAAHGRPWIVESGPGALDVVWSQASSSREGGLHARRIGENRAFHLTGSDAGLGVLPARNGERDLLVASVERERIAWFRRDGSGWQRLGTTAGGPGSSHGEASRPLAVRTFPVWRMGRSKVGIAFFRGRSLVALKIRLP